MNEEAVFSSGEDRIRASHASVAVAGHSIVSQASVAGRSPGWAHRFRAGRFWTGHAESLFAVLFPSDCRICGEPLLNISRLPVCIHCLESISPIRGKVCSICGDRVLSAYAERDANGLIQCPICRRVRRPFGRAAAYGSYESTLRELIHLLKYNGIRPAAKVLGGMLADAFTTLEPAFERLTFEQEPILVIPVPLYQAKRRQRGFNQAELIARAALRFYPARERLQLVSNLLLRTRDTTSQIGLSTHQRRANLRGAFAVARATEVTGREIILVDDVYTTGATATECAQVLRRAGASKVWVATVARTMKLASNYPDFRTDSDDPADGVSEEEEVLAKAAESSKIAGFKVSKVSTFQSETDEFETLKP
jgi:ComF family protein